MPSSNAESARVQNLADVLSVFAVKEFKVDIPTNIAEMDTNKINNLKTVFNDMNTVTSHTETADNTKLIIEITSKSYLDMIATYSFNSGQIALLKEFMLILPLHSGQRD